MEYCQEWSPHCPRLIFLGRRYDQWCVDTKAVSKLEQADQLSKMGVFVLGSILPSDRLALNWRLIRWSLRSESNVVSPDRMTLN